MIGIAVTVEAFEAVAERLSLGSVLYEAEVTSERLIWLEASAVNKFVAIRGPGEQKSEKSLTDTFSHETKKDPSPK